MVWFEISLAWEREFWYPGRAVCFCLFMLLYEDSCSFSSFAFLFYPPRNLCPPRAVAINLWVKTILEVELTFLRGHTLDILSIRYLHDDSQQE